MFHSVHDELAAIQGRSARYAARNAQSFLRGYFCLFYLGKNRE